MVMSRSRGATYGRGRGGTQKRAMVSMRVSATLSGHLEKILEHGGRAVSIVQRMVLHFRGGSGERRNELVVEALDLAYHGTRARDPNFNLTPRALHDRTVSQPRDKRLLAESGFARSGCPRCDAGSSSGDPAAPAEPYFALARSSRDSDHGSTVIGNLRVTGQLPLSE